MSVLEDLLNIFGMEVARIELAVNKRYPGGKVCNGHVRDVLKEIVTKDCKSTFVVRHSQIIIRNPNKGTKLGVLLSPGTGLLMTNNQESDKTNITPSQETQKSQKQRAEGGKTFSRESLLNYRIGPGDVIKIRDKTLNGDFIVKKGIHKGSRRGDWKTSLEVEPV